MENLVHLFIGQFLCPWLVPTLGSPEHVWCLLHKSYILYLIFHPIFGSSASLVCCIFGLLTTRHQPGCRSEQLLLLKKKKRALTKLQNTEYALLNVSPNFGYQDNNSSLVLFKKEKKQKKNKSAAK